MKAPNIILITIDSLRVDHLGCYGYHRNTSHNIDGLAAGGAMFLEAISNGGQTPQSFPAMLTSALPPLRKVGAGWIPPWRPTLAEILKENGYQTAAFHSNPHLSRFFGYARGFDIFSDSLETASLWKGRVWIRKKVKSLFSLTPKALTELGKAMEPILSRVASRPIVRAEAINKRALAWLKGRQGKFFLWVHYMDVHHPYLPGPEYLAQFSRQAVSRQKMLRLWRQILRNPGQLSSSDIATLVDLYDADIKYVDHAIGSLLSDLGSDLADTVIIVTADHGEEFGEHGCFSHQSLYDGILRVPLIMVGPGIKGGTVVKQPVSLLDLAPTIADMASINRVPGFDGKSLLPAKRGEGEGATGTISMMNKAAATARLISYRTPEWKYICTEGLDEAGAVLQEEVYDLVRDPGEKHNLHGSGDEAVRAFESEATDKLKESRQTSKEEQAAYEKRRIKAKIGRLRAL